MGHTLEIFESADNIESTSASNIRKSHGHSLPRNNVVHVLTFSSAQPAETGSVHPLVLSEHLSKTDERLGCIIVVHLGEVSKRAQYVSMW